MKKILMILKNNWELVGYCVLAVLLFFACFFRVFSWVTAVYIIFFAFFMQNEGKIAGLLLFLSGFYTIFSYTGISINYEVIYNLPLSYVITYLLHLFIVMLYVLRVKNREKRINFEILVLELIIFIYLMLPIHLGRIYDAVALVLSIASFYVIFSVRQEIDFTSITRQFIIGLILSCIYGLYQNISPLLHEYINHNVIYYDSIGLVERYQGLCSHTLQLAALSMLVICVLLFLKHRQKLSFVEFYLMFIPIFIFGYMTLSRAYILTVSLALLIFIIFEIKKYRRKSLFFLCSLVVVIGLVLTVLFKQTHGYFMRFTSENSYTDVVDNNITDEVLTDDLTVTAGRVGLLCIYFKDWISSWQIILFGRGISAMIFAVDSHNILMQNLWQHGVIGVILLILIFVSIFSWKKITNWKKIVSVLIIFVPWICFAMLEIMNFNYTALVLIVASIGMIEQSSPNYQSPITRPLVNKVEPFKQDLTNSNLLGNVKLSIIVPVYNGEKYLRSSIDNLLKINLNKEIIVVNDGSKDKSLEILQGYGNRIILINLEKNQGAAYARNQGIQQATGDYISIIDIDDEIELDMHVKILTKMIKEGADVGICNYDEVLLSGKVQKSKYQLSFESLSQTEIIRLFLCDKIVPLMVTTICNASLAKQIQFKKVYLAEDMIYQLRVILNAKKTCFVDEPLYHYVQHVSSYTNGIPITDKLIERLAIPDSISQDEKKMLIENYAEEYEYFRLLTIQRCVHGISSLANKSNYVDAKNLIQSILDQEMCRKIIKNHHTPVCIKFEFWVIKTFGVGLHLFLFPFYNAIKRNLRS